MRDKYFFQMDDNEITEESDFEQNGKTNNDSETYQFDGYVIEVNTTLVLTPVLQAKS